jgi:[ribosomal protein S5]-alanine N-acetyltransferase
MKLETNRLIIRKPIKSDWKEIYNLIDKSIIKNFFTPYPYKEKHSKELVDNAIKQWGKYSYEFVIQKKDTKEIIGMAGIKRIDNLNKTAYLFSWIGAKHRKQGYATEAKFKINDFCFKKLKLRKLISEVATFNRESNKMQEKMGMKLEGVKRKEYLNPLTKQFVDMNLWGLLKEEWKVK